MDKYYISFYTENGPNLSVAKANTFLFEKYSNEISELLESEKKEAIKSLWEREFNGKLVNLDETDTELFATHIEFSTEADKILFLMKWNVS